MTESTVETFASKSERLPVWTDLRIALALIGIGFAPLLYCHIAGMLMRPHYQFIALLPLALWLLSMTTSEESVGVDGGRPRASSRDVSWSIGLLSTSAIGLTLAVWAWSPWIAAVNGMIGAVAVVLRVGGWAMLKAYSPILVFCLVLIPLPFGIDEDLVVGLRSVTTRLSSSVLDQVGILHQAYANVIQLPGKALFIADACSGIQSLYVLLAMALFVSVFMRRSVLHSLCLLGSTFALVIIENVARIVSVAWASGHSMDWSKGTNHELLGVFLFAASAILVMSTDQLLLFLLPESWIDLARTALRLPPRSRFVAPASPGPLISPNVGLSQAWFAIACIFPVLGLMQLPRLLGNAPPVASLFSEEPKLAFFGEDAMPERWLGFCRVGYEQIDRVPGDPFGQSSQRWIYEKSGLTIGFSVDYPYDGAKDLCQCYTMIGWTVDNQVKLTVSQLAQLTTPALATSECARAEIERELFGQGLLLFSSLDRTGQPNVLLKELARGDTGNRIADRWSYQHTSNGQTPEESRSQPPFTQMHVLARSFEPMTEESQLEVTRFFLEARAYMTPRIIQSLEGSLDSAAAGNVESLESTNAGISSDSEVAP
jgi:exosortase